MSRTLGVLLQFPPGYAGVLLASPVVCVGAGVWWVLVERRDAYTYRAGGVFGLVTALVTVVLWLLVVTAIYGSLVVMGLTIVGLVLVVTLPVALLTGVVLVYARRRAG